MESLGLFLPGDSPVHRAAAGLKVVLLVLAGAASVLADSLPAVAGCLLLVLALHAVARVPVSVVAGQVRPLLWVLLPTAMVHGVVSGWGRAATVVGTIVALVLLASLVTLTTRTADLVEVLVRAARVLRPLRVDAQRVGLVLALGIRSVPVVVGLARQVREAQLARGLGASPRAFAVPLVVRAVRHADALGEALVARGADE